MIAAPHIEYRCACGRLLFKGAAPLTFLETKCKRCGAVISFNHFEHDDGAVHYGLLANAHGEILETSGNITEVLGYTKEELVGVAENGGVVPPAKTALHEWVLGSIPVRACVSFDSEHRTKAGGRLRVRARARLISAHSERHTLFLFEVVPFGEPPASDQGGANGVKLHEAVAEVNKTGALTYASAALCSLLKREHTALLGESVFAMFRLGEREAYQAWFEEMLRTRSSYVIGAAAVASGVGEEWRARIHFTPCYRDDGYLRGYTVMFEAC